MAEPLDNFTVKHYLQFGEETRRRIAEPTKFDAANFVLKQKDTGLGRDVSFASGTVNLRFEPSINFRGLTHQFPKIMEEYDTKGFEGDVKYILEIEGVDYVIGQLDFNKPDTDQFTFFDCKVIQDSKQYLVKRREKVKVDLFADTDVEGEPITPITSEKLFLRATPIFQKSEWILPFSSYGLDLTGEAIIQDLDYSFNPFPAIQKSGVEATLSPIQSIYGQSGLEEFAIIRAENTITNGTLVIEDLSYLMEFYPLNNFPFGGGGLYYYVGSNYQFGDATAIFTTPTLNENNPNFSITNETFTIDNLTIKRGEYLMVFFYAYGRHQNQSYAFKTLVTNGKMKFSGISTSISSTITVVNLGEAMKQVVKSISGLDIEAPRFLNEDGEFKKQYLSDGLRIRNITDEPFNVSLEDILGQLPEWRGDYEVTENGVFFGLFKDFYTNNKMASFVLAPDETFNSTTNDRYAVNTFEFKYGSYEKGNEESGSREGVHTSLQMLLPNKMVENNKAVNVGFIRDSFLIENNRKNAILVEDDTATTNDEDIFIIDGVEKTIFVNEEVILRHLRVDAGTLKLLNDGTFNWLFVGFSPNDFIVLQGENGGDWRVVGIEPAVVTLIAVGNSEATFSGETLTKLIFPVTSTNLTNRTSEGFGIINGTSNPDGFSNLRFTPKRNILNYWANYLLTAGYFQQGKLIKMTEFIHNRDLETFISGNPIFVVREGDNLNSLILELVDSAILTPFEITTKVLCDFSQFWDLRQKARTQRGYIEVRNNKGVKINVYPMELDYEWATNLLTIIGEKRIPPQLTAG